MIAVVLFGLVAAAAAAPHHHHGHEHRHGGPGAFGPIFNPSFDPFGEQSFNAQSFWSGLDQEMRMLDEMLANLNKHFATASGDTKIEGNQYVITIPLTYFDEKDIVVKAKSGFLMIQAIHNTPQGGQNIYIDTKTLPSNVDVAGTWTFNAEKILKIVFPIKKTEGAEEVPVTVAATVNPLDSDTKRPFIRDREEMSNESAENSDADVGLGDLDKTRALFTNEIPTSEVEGTTYAVDLNDEVEFVPVPYNK